MLSRSRIAGRRPRWLVGSALLATAAMTAFVPIARASTAPLAGGSVVSADPADDTPQVIDGEVGAIARIGHTVVVGGDFTQVRNAGSSAIQTRPYLFAYDETTGKVISTFNPVLGPTGKGVTSIVPAGDGQSVYLAGSFTTVNGTVTGRVAELDITSGQLVPGFTAARPNATVNDMALSNGRLIIAGDFTKVTPPRQTSVGRGAIASLDPTTGALTSAVTDTFAGIGTKGTTSVRRIDVAPAGDRLVAIGNFSTVDGQPRSLIAQLDLTADSSALDPWFTTQFPAFDSSGRTWCSSSFPSYMRDVAYSTDGSYFVAVTTGAYHAGRLCDSQSRWESTGDANAMPSWIEYTGGDTTTAVEMAPDGRVVYVGGHFRWLNNPFAGDRASYGAVSRIGLAALDPRNGLPYSWNPTRERGYGVYDFLSTPDGLFVGSDTDHVGGEYHPRLAFFPTEGGVTLPPEHVASLPATVELLGGPNGQNSGAQRSVAFDGSTASDLTSSNPADSWGSLRGAFAIDGQVYTGWSDGTLRVRSFDGASFGPSSAVPMSWPDPNSTTGYTPTNNFVADLPSVTGMFYDPTQARLYYTQSGSSSLYYRYFEPESQLVGAQKFIVVGDVSALDPRNVNGMFLADGQIYFADSQGQLKSVGFSAGQITGPATTINNALDWRSRGVFAWDGG
jgi:hypothetical protein